MLNNKKVGNSRKVTYFYIGNSDGRTRNILHSHIRYVNTNFVVCQSLQEDLCTVRKGSYAMSKTKSSTRGVQQKKIVPVKPYKKSDGTKVAGHRRSTPN